MADHDPRLELLFRDQWAGLPAIRGSLPRVPQRAALDTASEALAGCVVRIPGASGVADATYECQKQSDDSYAWVQIDAPAPSTAALPQGSLGVANAVATQSGITTETAITGLSISATLATKRFIRVALEGYFGNATSGAQNVATVKQNGSAIAAWAPPPAPSAGNGVDAYWAWVISLVAGSYAFTATLRALAGTASVSNSQLVVEDLGAAP